MTPELLERLSAARAEARPAVLATRLRDGAQHLLLDPHELREGSDALPPGLREAAAAVLDADRSGSEALDGEAWFLHAYPARLRLVVVGAVHIAQALVPMAAGLGWGVVVVDPRRAFATDERFPGVSVSTDWPDEAMDALRPDRRTAVVTLTHDPKLDDPALDRALRSEAFFVGALGSRRTHASRLERLRALGHGEDALARIRGPVGLPIGAVSAPEIALAVMAELVAVRRDGALARRPVAEGGGTRAAAGVASAACRSRPWRAAGRRRRRDLRTHPARPRARRRAGAHPAPGRARAAQGHRAGRGGDRRCCPSTATTR